MDQEESKSLGIELLRKLVGGRVSECLNLIEQGAALDVMLGDVPIRAWGDPDYNKDEDEKIETKLKRQVLSPTDNALTLASYKGDPGIMTEILAKTTTDLEYKNSFGWTAFMTAAHFDNLEVMKLLAQKGANVNTSTPEGITPLIRAVSNRSFEAMSFLIEAGASEALDFGEFNNIHQYASWTSDNYKLLCCHLRNEFDRVWKEKFGILTEGLPSSAFPRRGKLKLKRQL